MPETHWEHFDHGADIGVRGFGDHKAEAFAEAAKALTAVITDLDQVEPTTAVSISSEAPDDELLLAQWLNDLVYEMNTRRMLFSRFELRIVDQHLDATAWGEAWDPARHDLAVEVKGATYTALQVSQRDDGTWLAQCVVDV